MAYFRGNYELPDGSWDMKAEEADHQMAELEELARRIAAAKKRGICVHGWTGPADEEAWKAGTDVSRQCFDCGARFPSARDEAEAVRLARLEL